MRKKLIISTKKLINTALKAHLVYYYFHMYMVKNVFFGCRITSFIPNQEIELTKIYEQLIIDKLCLGAKFPRKVLYIHKKALGISLMKPNTVLSILALKLYFGHTRLHGSINNLININLEFLQVECGRNIALAEIPLNEKHWNKTWLDHIFEIC